MSSEAAITIVLLLGGVLEVVGAVVVVDEELLPEAMTLELEDELVEVEPPTPGLLR